MHWTSLGQRLPVVMTKTSAKLLKVKSWYLENHPFLMSEPAEKAPIHSLHMRQIYYSMCHFNFYKAKENHICLQRTPPKKPTSVFLSADERDDEDKETFPLYWMQGS